MVQKFQFSDYCVYSVKSRRRFSWFSLKFLSKISIFLLLYPQITDNHLLHQTRNHILPPLPFLLLSSFLVFNFSKLTFPCETRRVFFVKFSNLTMNEEREAEILALKSIFDENTFEISDDGSSGRFTVEVDAPNNAHFSLLAGSSQDESMFSVQIISFSFFELFSNFRPNDRQNRSFIAALSHVYARFFVSIRIGDGSIATTTSSLVNSDDLGSARCAFGSRLERTSR